MRVVEFSRKRFMKELQTLLLAEFYTASAYLNRILFVYFEIETLHRTPQGKSKIQDVFFNLKNYFSNIDSEVDYEFSLNNFRPDLNNVNALIESSLKNPFYSKRNAEQQFNYINLLYSAAFCLHQAIRLQTNSDVALPQSILGEIAEDSSEELNLIKLNPETMLLNSARPTKEGYVVEFLKAKRIEKYHLFVDSGHKKLAVSNFSEALKSFQYALSLNETAEILNLIGWTYSLAGDLVKAKSFSLKAIEKDAQYGPALNDYGNYLFLEGNIKESLKWFELAKRSLNYENREFAFINAGKAYMQLNMFEEALNEFSLALSFTPYNHELHDAVKKIRENLTKEISHERFS